MATLKDTIFDELIGSRVEELLQDDHYYQGLATSLKPAEVIKNEHRQQLLKALKMDDLQKHLIHAEELIKENHSDKFKKVIEEIEHSNEHMVKYYEQHRTELESKGTDPVLLKDIYGISNDSLSQIYELSKQYVTKKDFSNAESLLTYLTILAPDIIAFWISLGICFQALHKEWEAINIFNIAKILDQTDPAAYIYAAESYLNLKENDKAKMEIDAVKPFLNNKDGVWKDSLAFVQQQI